MGLVPFQMSLQGSQGKTLSLTPCPTLGFLSTAYLERTAGHTKAQTCYPGPRNLMPTYPVIPRDKAHHLPRPLALSQEESRDTCHPFTGYEEAYDNACDHLLQNICPTSIPTAQCGCLLSWRSPKPVLCLTPLVCALRGHNPSLSLDPKACNS